MDQRLALGACALQIAPLEPPLTNQPSRDPPPRAKAPPPRPPPPRPFQNPPLPSTAVRLSESRASLAA